MSPTPAPIAVIGATGQQGGAVVTALLIGACLSAPWSVTLARPVTSPRAASRSPWPTWTTASRCAVVRRCCRCVCRDDVHRAAGHRR